MAIWGRRGWKFLTNITNKRLIDLNVKRSNSSVKKKVIEPKWEKMEDKY